MSVFSQQKKKEKKKVHVGNFQIISWCFENRNKIQ